MDRILSIFSRSSGDPQSTSSSLATEHEVSEQPVITRPPPLVILDGLLCLFWGWFCFTQPWPNGNDSFIYLPKEIMLMIMDYFPVKTIARMRCQHFFLERPLFLRSWYIFFVIPGEFAKHGDTYAPTCHWKLWSITIRNVIRWLRTLSQLFQTQSIGRFPKAKLFYYYFFFLLICLSKSKSCEHFPLCSFLKKILILSKDFP